MLQVHSALLSDTGRKRPHNEDYVAFFEPNEPEELNSSGSLYIVADGVGGASKGERASRYAAQKVLYEYYRYPQVHPGERLKRSMRQACSEIFAFAAESENFIRMATTMVAAVVHGDRLTVANVGDSRAYLLRGGQIKQITHDHSYVGEMLREGIINEEQAQNSKGKNRLTRSLGGEADVQVDVFADIPLQPGDALLMCSDGLTRYAAAEDLLRLASQGEPEEIVQRLVAFANQKGGADNISAVLVNLETAPPGLEGTLRTSRGHAPTPVDWETMTGEITASQAAEVKNTSSPSARSLLFGLPLTREEMPLVVGGIVLLFVVCFLASALLVVSNLKTANPTPTPTMEMVGTIPVPEPQIIAPTQDLVATQAFTATQAITATQPMTMTQPLTTTLPLTQTQAITPVQGATGDCEYIVQSGDTIYDLSLDFGKPGLDPNTVVCAQIPGNEACLISSENEYIIQPGWVLVFPGIDQEQCTARRGTPK